MRGEVTSTQRHIPKPVIATLEPGTNFVFHMIAVAKAGFENAYSETYRDSIAPDDLSILTKYRKELSWLDGGVGTFAPLFVFELARANPGSVLALREFFSLFEEGLGRGGFGRYLERYHSSDSDDPFSQIHPEPGEGERYLRSLAIHRDAIEELAGVYTRRFDNFMKTVWPIESAKMAPVAGALTAHFGKRDIIGRWEEVTGQTWRRPSYQIRLCAALHKGPQANSLFYDVNTFYYASDPEWMKDFISHEIGTHILIDANNEVMMSRKYDRWLVYRAFENLARFYNFTVLGKEKLYGMGPHYSVPEFEGIYSEIDAQEPNIRPEALLVKGIERFLNAGHR